jgi:glycosyltransferase involved in cell wall biosynthesis
MAADFDVVHLNSNHPGSRLGILMGFALGASGRPVVCVEQGVSPISAIQVPAGIAWALPALFRWSRRSVARLVAVSEENRRRLIELYRVPADKITTVYNGFDPLPLADGAPGTLRQELGLSDDQPLILVLGRLSANKGQRHLIDAAPAILSRFPGAHFVFAGNPEGQAELDRRITALRLEGHFSMPGFRSDVVNLLRSCDLFVLPSLAEGFSLSLVEAMAAGVPVVATRVGGAAEVVEDGVSGFLTPPGDVGALAHAVIAALSLDAAARDRLRDAARSTAQRFSFAATASRMLDIYSELGRRGA